MRRFVWVPIFLLSLALATGWATVVDADDWPQWFGPQRDGVWRESGIMDAIPAEGLPVRWRSPVSGGYSGPAVAEGRVFVTDYVRREGDASNDPSSRRELQGSERVLCFAQASGRLLWRYEYECPYKISYPAGPRATPTVDGDRLYTLGAEGHLLCLAVETGNVIWSKQLQEAYHIEAPLWGFAAHPLIDGDRLICVVGGEGSVAVAFDKKSGGEVWKAVSASEPGYCAPTIITAAGTRQLLIWDADKLNGLNPATGESYWTLPLKPDFGMSIAPPRQVGDYLFASAIRNVAAVMKLDSKRPGAEITWQARGPKESVFCAISTPFVEDGVVFGTDCNSGALIGADLMTGEQLWETFDATTGDRRASHGSAFLVRQGQRYILLSETGHLIFAKLTRTGYEELGRTRVIEPTGEAFGRPVVWSYPAFAGRCLFVRNDNEIVCLSLASSGVASDTPGE
jgi:outer membrane protein assembly factor BamB